MKSHVESSNRSPPKPPRSALDEWQSVSIMRPMLSRVLFFIPCAVVVFLVWYLLPGSPADRAAFSLTTRAFEHQPFFIIGDGTHAQPYAVHPVNDASGNTPEKAPTIVSLGDDTDGFFQSSPPSPVDFAIILKNFSRLGETGPVIAIPLAWQETDVISLAALDLQLDALPSVLTTAPLTRSANPSPIPPAFRRASVPVSNINGDPSNLPVVNHIPIPNIILGNQSSLAGFSFLESESADAPPHLLALWDDSVVLSLPLLTAMRHFETPPSALEIRLGEYIAFGENGPYIPIDDHGRLAFTPQPLESTPSISAHALIDSPGDLLAGNKLPPAILRNDLSSADPRSRQFSKSLAGTIAALTHFSKASASRKFPRLAPTLELCILGLLVLGLATASAYPVSRKPLTFVLSICGLVALHFIIVPLTGTWLPTLPAIATVAIFGMCVVVVTVANMNPEALDEEEPPFPESKKTPSNIPPINPAQGVAKKVAVKIAKPAFKITQNPLRNDSPLSIGGIDPFQKDLFARAEILEPTISHRVNPTEKANALIEALPYFQAFRSKTILIKMGGSAMEDPELVANVMRDITFLEIAGINPVIVHGGGKAISAAMEAAGLEPEFVNGFRVTTEEAIDIVSRVLSLAINPCLVRMIRQLGGKAIGIPGTDIFLGEKTKCFDKDGKQVDLGRVGEVVGCNLDNLEIALKSGIVPVISPLATELPTGKPLNINADLAAAALAKELRVSKLVYLSDVPGLLADPKDPSSLIKSINVERANALIEDGTISGGMIPKVRSAIDALNAGVRKVHFVDGRLPHALLLEIFTDGGIGTEVTR